MADALYRTRQFLRGFHAAPAAHEVETVRALLTDAERALFLAMLPRDRRHSLDMVRWLRAHATPPDDVLAAVLLHDIGKGPLRVWDRVAFVLLGAVGHGLRARVAAQGGGRFRRALWRLEHHARLGAERLSGSRPRVVWLVAHHTAAAPPANMGPAAEADLALLMAADAAC